MSFMLYALELSDGRMKVSRHYFGQVVTSLVIFYMLVNRIFKGHSVFIF